VQHAFDANGGDRGAFDGAEQRTPQALPMVVPNPRSKGWALNLPNVSVSVSASTARRFGF
jgi:hypothetical protein